MGQPDRKDEYLSLKALYDAARVVTQTDTKSLVVLNFKALQLLPIKRLQNELFNLHMNLVLGAVKQGEEEETLAQIEITLKDYCALDRCLKTPLNQLNTFQAKPLRTTICSRRII